MVKPAPDRVELDTVIDKGEVFYRTSVYLDQSLVDRFKESFPQQGALKEFFNSCLRKFVEIHEAGRLDAEISETVQSVVEEMKDESLEG